MVLFLGLVAGLLQVCGYLAYMRKSLSEEIDPNPSTWFMFSYGTATLTILEWDREAPWEILVLPVVCATLSIFVAAYCWKKGTLTWPESWIDRSAFLTDIVLTGAYVSARMASSNQLISEHDREVLVIGFLICTNLSTIVSFIPLMRNAQESEHPLPWGIWSLAYAVLAITTVATNGWDELSIYPVSNSILHGLVAILALRRGCYQPARQ